MNLFSKPLHRAKFQQVLTISLAWIVISLLISGYETIVFDYDTDTFYINKPAHHDLLTHFLFNLMSASIGSIIGAVVSVYWLGGQRNQSSYGKMIFFHSLIYVLVILMVSMIIGFIYSASYYETSMFDPIVLEGVINFFTGYAVFRIVFIWYILIAFTVFLLQVNKKYGPWVLFNFVMGKYHKPRTEIRIFMFLDLKSSTTIAERIGHTNYFKFLKKTYDEITTPVLNHRGEIYQYVGDEVVLTWTIKNGVRDAKCIACFYAIQHHLREKAIEFIHDFGSPAEFKAGMHVGQVTVGEIGIIKKDIVYTGDVVNTTARIMQKCKQYDQDLIISQDLKRRLPPISQYEYSAISSEVLKGKNHRVMLFGVTDSQSKNEKSIDTKS